MSDAAQNWYDPEVATFGDRLAAARDQAKLTQAALAKRLGVKASTVRKWEDDLSEPRANRLSMLAGVLGVSMGWLINGSGDGVDAPDGSSLDTDLATVLSELRDIRVSFAQKAEQVGRIEKRLRTILAEQRGE